MDAWTQTKQRLATQELRQPPRRVWSRRIEAESKGELEAVSDQSLELVLETTDATGELALWFDDFWWVDALTLYKRKTVTVHIAPSSAALLNRVVLHQLEMLRRVEPLWKAIGYAYVDDFTSKDLRRMALSAYHEIRVIDAARPISDDHVQPNEPAMNFDQVMAGYEAAESLGGRKPGLTRLCPDDAHVAKVIRPG